MKLKVGSIAWHTQLTAEIVRLKRMVEGDIERSRREADHTIKMIAREIENIPDIKMRMSVVSYDPKVCYCNEPGTAAGFYNSEMNPVTLAFRAEQYWGIAGEIVKWYYKTGKKYVRKGGSFKSSDNEGGRK